MKKKIKVKALDNTPFLLSQQQEIGKGNFGRVVRAYKKDQPSRQLVAKIIPIVPENKETIVAQIKILKQIPYHQNLVNCIKMQVSSEHNFYLIMEYCNGGSFEQYIQQNHNCSQEIIWRFLKQFTKGYKVLYDCHLVHRDIKPENILIHNKAFKIADFGFSRKVNHHNLTQNLSMKGTPLYIAPQLQSQSAGNSKIDVFSLGIVVYRLAFNGAHPFYRDSINFTSISQYFEHVAATPLKFPKYPKRSPQLTELISSMLEKNPVARISWKDIFQHPKIKEKQQTEEKEVSEQFVQLRKSIIEIGKSAASLEVISEPFHHENQVGAEMLRLVQFTQYLPAFQVRGLQIFVTRSKVIIELIKHLNGILKTQQQQRKLKFNDLMQQIIIEGYVYSEYTLGKLKEIIEKYEVHIADQGTNAKLLGNLERDRKSMVDALYALKIQRNYEHLRYENLLYDYLTQFCELKPTLKQKLKIPTALMVDLYDGLLKLESMIKFNENGRIQVVEIQLQDAELDKIDYSNLATYERYLDEINDITLNQVERSLKSMGLMIL